jgi:Fe-S-cluster containining protein
LWHQADRAQAAAQERYPAMACRSGCNDCCKHHGSPMTYAPEWEVIEAWLERHPEQLPGIRERYAALKARLRARLHSESVPSLNEALFEVPCPCIEPGPTGERCAIYEVRPLTCRSYGNTLLQPRPASSAEIYTCNPEKDRWERDLPVVSEIELPLRAELFAAFEAQPAGTRRSLLSYLERFLAQNPPASEPA